MSLLKDKIDKFTEETLAKAPKLVEYWWQIAREICDFEPIQNFTVYLVSGGDVEDEMWEIACDLDMLPKDLVAEKVGLVFKFTNATECEVTYSGK